MNSAQHDTKIGGVNNSPLKFYQPLNIAVFMTFYSPVIVALSVTSLSFVFQNFKGFIFFGYLLGSCILRNFAYMMNEATPIKDDHTICTSVQYSQYGNATFSAFVFAFTIVYLSIPMFSEGDPNFWVFSALLVYFSVDVGIKMYKKCVISPVDLALNILAGAASAGLIVAAMYAGGSGSYLFFNQATSSSEKCSMPDTQTFRCSVYKNGELIGNMPAG
jgi:hypothetical protein